jgi:hypothetical protein
MAATPRQRKSPFARVRAPQPVSRGIRAQGDHPAERASGVVRPEIFRCATHVAQFTLLTALAAVNRHALLCPAPVAPDGLFAFGVLREGPAATRVYGLPRVPLPPSARFPLAPPPVQQGDAGQPHDNRERSEPSYQMPQLICDHIGSTTKESPAGAGQG